MPLGRRAGLSAAVLFTCLFLSGPGLAEPADAGFRLLGQGWLATNDSIGDGKDRWRSVSVTHGAIAGAEWMGRLPDRPGQILEYRFRTEVIAPANLVAPDPADRRYAGVLSAGLHSHFALGRAEARIGADLVAVGPQTGVARLHEGLHELFGLGEINPDAQRLENAVHPTLSAEIGLPLALGARGMLRPFADLRHGDEDLLRLGFDLALGAVDDGALWLRDPVTGQRFVGIRGDAARGFYLSAGADVAAVASSAWLPEGGAAVARDSRARARLGLGYAGTRGDAFYGLTWLSKEFEGQDEGQVVGSVTLRLRF